jgi:pSer/pThr/pTyr-binding forkhead associated (FHA) protein
MNLYLQIFKHGEHKKSVRLPPGEYTLGRDSDSDIVLNDNSVSTAHAKLSVTARKVVVADAGSLNGIYFNNKKIKKKTFTKSYDLEIGPYILKGIIEKQDKQNKSAQASNANRIASHIKAILIFVIALMIGAAAIVIYLPLNEQMLNFQIKEIEKRGILFGRYLSEVNRNLLEVGRTDNLLISPIDTEEGVIYARIVDSEGNIIAPADLTGQTLEWSGFENAKRKDRSYAYKLNKYERIIYFPIRRINRILGIAIIKINVKNAFIASEYRLTGDFQILLIFLLAVGAVCGHFIVKLFLKPLHELGEEISVAIKEGRSSVSFYSPYREITDLVAAFNRLLIRCTSTENDNPDAKVNSSGAETASDAQFKNIPSSYAEETTESSQETIDFDRSEFKMPWCILDMHKLIILEFNTAFVELLGDALVEKGNHLAELAENMRNPGLSNAIIALLNSYKNTRSVVLEPNQVLELSQSDVKADGSTAMITFKEAASG